MDSTVALIFSLGLALSGQDTTAAGIETTPAPVKTAPLSQRQHEVRQRIKLTNAWLKQQKQARLALIKARHQPDTIQLANELSCTANWDTA